MSSRPIPSRRKSFNEDAVPSRSYYTRNSVYLDHSDHSATPTLSFNQIRLQSKSWTTRELRNSSAPSTPLKPDDAIAKQTIPNISQQSLLNIQRIEQSLVSDSRSVSIELDEQSIHETRPLLKPTNQTMVSSSFAIVLGLILNILDAMSYGVIIFPTFESFIPQSAAQAGISMFLASTIVAQITYSLNSQFEGAVGSMMIEVMPFLHIMCKIVQSSIPNESSVQLMPTIMTTFASSTILTGLLFFLLGKFNLGNVVQFFPRHILVGCIGGIGLFLLLTGVQVTSGIQPSFDSIPRLFELFYFKLWSVSLGLAILLKIVQRHVHKPLLVPVFYICIPILFYLVFWLILGFKIDQLRDQGWLFKTQKQAPFYEFFTWYDLGNTNWIAVVKCIPTMLALAAFGILHVPINVPALAISTMQEVDTNIELISHGYSNLIAGILGTCQNYLVYSNSVLFYRSGGNSRVYGFGLAIATIVIWIFGSTVASFVPIVVVGALIFHLGFDLLKESVYDTYYLGMHTLDYLTVIFIVIVMGFVGFTEGIIAGMILACVFFVFNVSNKSVIRNSSFGSEFKSPVHRPAKQQMFLKQAANQIFVLQLQGFMFFGTVNQLDDTVKMILSESVRISYLIIDFSLISGIDYSATESLHRLKRLVKCNLVFCGLSEANRHLLQRALIFEDGQILLFDSFPSALEYSENELLSTFYEMNTPPLYPIMERDSTQDSSSPKILREFLVELFSEFNQLSYKQVKLVASKFTMVHFGQGSMLWDVGDDSDEIYIVENGELDLLEKSASEYKLVETYLCGSMVGQLQFFSGSKRINRLHTSQDSLIWRLTSDAFEELKSSDPQLALLVVSCALQML